MVFSARKKLSPLDGDLSLLTVRYRCLGCRRAGLPKAPPLLTEPLRCLGEVSVPLSGRHIRHTYWDQPRQPLPFVFLGAYQRDLATTAFSHSSKTIFLPWHPASFWESSSLHNSRGKKVKSIVLQLISPIFQSNIVYALG